jgi:hypothetical protein
MPATENDTQEIDEPRGPDEENDFETNFNWWDTTSEPLFGVELYPNSGTNGHRVEDWEITSPNSGSITMRMFSPSPFSEQLLDPSSAFSSFTFPITAMDRDALHSLGNEALFSISGTKTPKWSTHAVMLRRGSSHTAIMRLVLAASLTELAWKKGGNVLLQSLADGHYDIGHDMLVGMIDGRGSSDEQCTDPLLVLISCWFWYLRNWRNQNRDQLGHREMSRHMRHYFRRHQLDHLLSSLAATPESCIPGEDFDSASRLTLIARLTSWIFWADAAACSLGNGGSFARFLAKSPGGELSTIYARSKNSLAYHWRLDYPADQYTDDDMNERSLDSMHQTWVVIQGINQELEDGDDGPLDTATCDMFAARIEDLLDRYADVVELAQSRGRARDRRVGNANWAVAQLYGLCIYLLRSGTGSDGITPVLRHTVSKIARNPGRLIDIMDESLDDGPPGQKDRFQWPLFWAGVETRGRVHQNWALDRIVNSHTKAVLVTVVEEQTRTKTRLGISRIRKICRAEPDQPG